MIFPFMRKTSCLIFISFLLVSEARAEGNWQYWNNDSVTLHLKGPWYLRVAQEFRFGWKLGPLEYEHTEAGLIHHTKKWLHFSLYYRQAYQKNRWETEGEYRPHLSSTFLWKWGRVFFAQRNRIEHRYLFCTKDTQRFRPKLTLSMPLGKKDRNIAPFIAEEYFIDSDDNTFNFNRLMGGFEISWHKMLKTGIFYLWQNNEGRGTASTSNALGTSVKIIF